KDAERTSAGHFSTIVTGCNYGHSRRSGQLSYTPFCPVHAIYARPATADDRLASLHRRDANLSLCFRHHNRALFLMSLDAPAEEVESSFRERRSPTDVKSWIDAGQTATIATAFIPPQHVSCCHAPAYVCIFSL